MSYGGGFLQGSSQGGQDSPGGNKRSGVQNLRPVTIHQLLSATQAHPDAEFVIDGQETKDVSFVACVRNMTKTATNVSYLVEDGTGQIDARKWSEAAQDDEDEGGVSADGIELNTYIRILGSIKVFSGKRHINASHVHKVTDFNEVLFHQVEVVHTHLRATRGPPGGGAGPTTAKAEHGDGHNPYAAGATSASAGAGAANAHGDLPIAQRRLMQHISTLSAKGDLPEEGINIHALHREAGGSLSVDKVKLEVSQLVDEGHLYCTIDDDHVLPTA